MPPLNMSRRSYYNFSKLLDKYTKGKIAEKGFINVSTPANVHRSAGYFYNTSFQTIKAGDRACVIGCDMPSYPFEEAVYFVENANVYLNLQPIGEEGEDDRIIVPETIEPWECKYRDGWQHQGFDLGFYVVKLSDAYNGTDDFYYAKEYEPAVLEKQNWLYTPYFITSTKKNGATWRILDGSNLSWRLLYPDYYKKAKFKDDPETPRVVLALMQRLREPEIPLGRYVATVKKDTTIDDNKIISVEWSTTENGVAHDYSANVWSPLSAVGDKFKKGQRVLIGIFNNTDQQYTLINAEC